VYIIEQLAHQLTQPKPGGSESYLSVQQDPEAARDANVRGLELNQDAAVELLKRWWPLETEDIVRNNKGWGL